MKAFNLSPEAVAALKKASLSLFNPSPEAAAWMAKNRPSEAEIIAMLEDYYLSEATTDGRVH